MKETVLFSSMFGSRLYGTNTEKSDLDLMTVIIPSSLDIYKGKVVPHKSITTNDLTKNSSDDVDNNISTLSAFLGDLSKGDMRAVDFIHSPDIKTEYPLLLDTINNMFLKNPQLQGYYKTFNRIYNQYVNIEKDIVVMAHFCKVIGDIAREYSAIYLATVLDLWEVNKKTFGNFMDGITISEDYAIVLGKKYQTSQSVPRIVGIIKARIDKLNTMRVDAMNNSREVNKEISQALRSAYTILMIKEGKKFPLEQPFNDIVINCKLGGYSFPQLLNILKDARIMIGNYTEVEPINFDDLINDFYTKTLYFRLVNKDAN